MSGKCVHRDHEVAAHDAGCGVSDIRRYLRDVPETCALRRGPALLGRDFLIATSGRQMEAALEMVLEDASVRRELVKNGLNVIRRKHTCAHRACELLAIASAMGPHAELEMNVASTV